VRGASTDPDGVRDAHRGFHVALLARCTNERMLELVGSLAEHRTLCEDALAGDIDGGVRHLREHLMLTVDRFRAREEAAAGR
jgi:DNA-binding GntR family transcriptional regulator